MSNDRSREDEEMTIFEVSEMPTSIPADEARNAVNTGAVGLHESLTRAFHIVKKVREFCDEGIPPHIIKELIEVMETDWRADVKR